MNLSKMDEDSVSALSAQGNPGQLAVKLNPSLHVGEGSTVLAMAVQLRFRIAVGLKTLPVHQLSLSALLLGRPIPLRLVTRPSTTIIIPHWRQEQFLAGPEFLDMALQGFPGW